MMKYVLCIAMLMAIAVVTLAAPEPEARLVLLNQFLRKVKLGYNEQLGTG
jgi:hypothetical protein